MNQKIKQTQTEKKITIGRNIFIQKKNKTFFLLIFDTPQLKIKLTLEKIQNLASKFELESRPIQNCEEKSSNRFESDVRVKFHISLFEIQ